MKTSQFSAIPTAARGQSDDGVDEQTTQAVFDALHDQDCRCILEAVNETPRSTKEIAEACDLPLSTTYRKVDLLTDADLIEERTRMDLSGNHASEYVNAVEDVTVTVKDGELQLELSRHGTNEGPAPAMVNVR